MSIQRVTRRALLCAIPVSAAGLTAAPAAQDADLDELAHHIAAVLSAHGYPGARWELALRDRIGVWSALDSDGGGVLR